MEADDELTAEIRAQVDEWSSGANDCLTLSLVRSDGSVVGAPFHPEFTYPIFGDEEVIFGYQGLDINLAFHADNLWPRLTIEYDKVFKAQGEVKPTDIREALTDFLPAEALSGGDEPADAASFWPPGEKIRSYARGDRRFEIWCSSLADPAAKKLLENMQIFVPMFIEGGTILSLEQDWTTRRWKLFLLYEYDRTQQATPNSPYSLVGYGTSYRVFAFTDRKSTDEMDRGAKSEPLESFLPSPDSEATVPHITALTPLDLPSRERLSQFLILPPFQGHGHGQELYSTMYAHLTAPENVQELTVEDPNEAFDDLRDLCDLLTLRKDSEFTELHINTTVPADQMKDTIPTELIVSGEARKRLLKKTKINERQFDRLVEMHTLSLIPPYHRSRSRITRKERSTNANDKAYFFWRLYTKQRLYIFNRDQLAQVPREERVERLESALDSVQEGYATLLEKVEAQEKSHANGSETVATSLPTHKARKRKVVGDDEDEDEDGDEPVAAVTEPAANGHKRARTAEVETPQ